MSYLVYVLYSERLEKYYVGYTKDLDERMSRHNTGRSRFTSKGLPWKLIRVFNCTSRLEAIRLEKIIKSRGIKRFLEEN
ncbi:GIY-YIG nuclease family protein [Muriicola jejuensis]|uniref:GIY-YIG nuclease family protein n=1 Tax=Muriicola jejuensis TaxID=504488 RepID=A0A6P0UG45_9FLAO|nr:GIY-YIG nuclease family protein [Muriicola jejuensis]